MSQNSRRDVAGHGMFEGRLKIMEKLIELLTHFFFTQFLVMKMR